MEDTLSYFLKQQFEKEKNERFFHPRGAPLVSHLHYVDDLLVFCNGEKRSMNMLMRTLRIYEK